MTNSHLLGFVTFGSFTLFALLAWAVSYKHPDVVKNAAMQRRTRRTALFLLVIGVPLGYVAFFLDNQLRVTTLHEVMVEGSAGARTDTPAPLRTVAFTVEHPGVEHVLFLSPISETFHPPESAVEISFSLHGPNGEMLLAERTESFAVRAASRRERADWEGRTFSFTPGHTGLHTVRVRPRTTGIPRIQVRLEDPIKRDGERMSGY